MKELEGSIRYGSQNYNFIKLSCDLYFTLLVASCAYEYLKL